MPSISKKRIPRELRLQLQHNYEKLCMYLNFTPETKEQVRDLLNSNFVAPFFGEYRRDYLEVTAEPEYVDIEDLSAWCLSKRAFESREYASPATPDKRNWTVVNHAARFLVRVLSFSWENGGEWVHGAFDPNDFNSELEIYQVWCILRYLQEVWEAENVES